MIRVQRTVRDTQRVDSQIWFLLISVSQVIISTVINYKVYRTSYQLRSGAWWWIIGFRCLDAPNRRWGTANCGIFAAQAQAHRILWIHERIKNMLAEDIELSCMTWYELMLTYQQISTWKVLNTVLYWSESHELMNHLNLFFIGINPENWWTDHYTNLYLTYVIIKIKIKIK